MIAKVNIIQIKELMEINEFENSDLSVETDLGIYTIDRILAEGTATLKSIVKISKVLGCNISDIMLKN
ncbi:MAG: helix-turn-helix domain-containing protein [Peptostreptococcaceae bacterium]|nr:helix-turn-helix domain-containing protein [Peptostreptococcaceae bacterium]